MDSIYLKMRAAARGTVNHYRTDLWRDKQSLATVEPGTVLFWYPYPCGTYLTLAQSPPFAGATSPTALWDWLDCWRSLRAGKPGLYRVKVKSKDGKGRCYGTVQPIAWHAALTEARELDRLARDSGERVAA